MNTVAHLLDLCHELGLSATVQDGTICLCFEEPVVILVRPQPQGVAVLRPIGRVATPYLPEAIQLANRLNAAGYGLGAFWVREQDGLVAYEVTVPAATALTPEQLGCAILAAGEQNQLCSRFAPLLHPRQPAQQIA
jgi:hypothetical protein